MIVDEIGQSPEASQVVADAFAQHRQQQREDADRLSARLDAIPPAARMVVPAAVTIMVDRKRHPVWWTLFGAVPLGFAVVSAVSKGRLF